MNHAANMGGPEKTPPMRSFFAIWTGQAFSLLGSQLVQFALIWWLSDTTGSATVLAAASMVGLLPSIIIGPFAGALVDRCSRRSVLIVADGVIALSTALLAVLYAADVAQIWHVYALLFIRSAGASFHWPAMQASTTLLVPKTQLSRIAGLNQTLAGSANIVGPPLAALAYSALPLQGLLTIDVVTALLAIIPLLFVSIPQPIRDKDVNGEPGCTSNPWLPSIMADMREGLRFITNWPGLLMFSCIGTVSNLLGRAATSLLPLVVIEHFAGGALELGWLQSAIGIGAVLGGVALGLWGGFRRRMTTVLLALALDGVALTLFGLTPTHGLLVALAAMFASGFLETIVMGMNGAIFQTVVPAEMQGRVFSLLISMAQVATPLGLAVAGPVADAMGARFWYLLAGIAITAMGVGGFLVPAIIRIEHGMPRRTAANADSA